MLAAYRRYMETFSWVNLTIDVLRIVIIILVVVGASNTLISGRFTGAQWVTLFISGLAQGSIYALIALGYTLVYGILLMINFAHGEVLYVGRIYGGLFGRGAEPFRLLKCQSYFVFAYFDYVCRNRVDDDRDFTRANSLPPST